MSYTLIQTVTVGSGGAASISLNSIPGTFTDLFLVISARNTGNNIEGNLQINGSSANRSRRDLIGNGSGVGSDTATNIVSWITNPSSTTANTFCSAAFYFPNYSGSSNKSFSIDSVNESNGTTGYQRIVAELWSDTSAITSFTISNTSGNLAEFSSASLYGITKGSSGGVVVS